MKCVIFAFALLASTAIAEPITVTDLQGVKHGTGFIQSDRPHLGATYFSPSQESMDAAPEKYDARQDGYVAPIRDQGQCGSCWDFSETKTLESARLFGGQKYLDLAEQDPLVNDSSNYGCQGGFMNADYWVKHGVALEKDCPYTADSLACSGKPADHGLAWGFVGAAGRAPTEDELKAAIYQYKVISITVAAGGSDWNGGNGGQMTSCGNSGVNHMVNLVGYDCTGSRAQGWWPWPWHPFKPHRGGKCTFIGANSWGTNWGDKGFFYAKQGCNEMASTADSALWISYQTAPAPTPPHVKLPAEVDASPGVEVMIGVRAEQGVDYKWSTGETEPMIYVKPAADTIYTLTGTNGAGASSSSVKVHILPSL